MQTDCPTCGRPLPAWMNDPGSAQAEAKALEFLRERPNSTTKAVADHAGVRAGLAYSILTKLARQKKVEVVLLPTEDVDRRTRVWRLCNAE